MTKTKTGKIKMKKFLILMASIFSAAMCGAGEVRAYVDLHRAQAIEIEAKEKNLIAISNDGSDKTTPDSFGLQYKNINDGNTREYSYEHFSHDQLLLKYAQFSFGPLKAGMPVSTRESLKVQEENLRVSQGLQTRINDDVNCELIYGAGVTRSSLSISGDKSYSDSGNIVTGLLGVRFESAWRLPTPLKVEYTKTRSLSSSRFSYGVDRLTIGGEVYSRDEAAIELAIFMRRGEYTYKGESDQAKIFLSVSGIQLAMVYR